VHAASKTKTSAPAATRERHSGGIPNRAGRQPFRDDSVEDALRTMKEHAVRRLPVVDGHNVVGMLSQADIAKNLPKEQTGDLVEAISEAP